MVENIGNISSDFFKAIYQLAGLPYAPIAFSQHSLEARAIVSQFIYEPLTDEQKQQIDNRSKTHRMQIPPGLDSMIDLPFVLGQVNIVLDQIANGKSYEDINELYRTGDPVNIEDFNYFVSKLVKSNGK